MMSNAVIQGLQVLSGCSNQAAVPQQCHDAKQALLDIFQRAGRQTETMTVAEMTKGALALCKVSGGRHDVLDTAAAPVSAASLAPEGMAAGIGGYLPGLFPGIPSFRLPAFPFPDAQLPAFSAPGSMAPGIVGIPLPTLPFTADRLPASLAPEGMAGNISSFLLPPFSPMATPSSLLMLLTVLLNECYCCCSHACRRSAQPHCNFHDYWESATVSGYWQLGCISNSPFHFCSCRG